MCLKKKVNSGDGGSSAEVGVVLRTVYRVIYPADFTVRGTPPPHCLVTAVTG